MTTQKISNQRLKRGAEHVCYEIQMIYFITQELTKKTPTNQSHINILLVACCVHLRNLLDFFYTKKRRYPDDMLAQDYISNPSLFNKKRTKKSDLDHLSKKVDKQIAHLTYHRNRYNQKNKGWNFDDIYKRLYPTIAAFYESLPEHRKKWPHFIEVKKIIDV